MDTEKELWDRLDGEPSRAYEAFQSFLSLPGSNRTLIAAYRHFVGNASATGISDTWQAWSYRYAWKERARAYDSHMDFLRRRGIEKAVEEEAERQMRDAERRAQNLSGLLKQAYAATEEFLENVDPAEMRFSDAVQVIRLHIEHVDKFGSGYEGQPVDDWTETDDEIIEKIARDIKARAAEVEAEEDSKSDTDEDRSEENEDEQD